jgi:hypothetical protein
MGCMDSIFGCLMKIINETQLEMWHFEMTHQEFV